MYRTRYVHMLHSLFNESRSFRSERQSQTYRIYELIKDMSFHPQSQFCLTEAQQRTRPVLRVTVRVQIGLRMTDLTVTWWTEGGGPSGKGWTTFSREKKRRLSDVPWSTTVTTSEYQKKISYHEWFE